MNNLDIFESLMAGTTNKSSVQCICGFVHNRNNDGKEIGFIQIGDERIYECCSKVINSFLIDNMYTIIKLYESIIYQCEKDAESIRRIATVGAIISRHFDANKGNTNDESGENDGKR